MKDLWETISKIGFADTLKAQRHLQDLPGRGVSSDDVAAFIPLLLEALRESPDPDRSLSAFARWFAATETPRPYLPLLHQPGILARFCFVTGCSQYFADLLARNPNDFSLLAEPEKLGSRETPARRYYEITRLVEDCPTLDQQRDTLRRWKAREMLQIGVRDLLGLDDMPTTAHEFSNLADACVQMALDIALASMGNGEERREEEKKRRREENLPEYLNTRTPEHPVSSFPANPLAVFALGKHGGQELNYSSDIDLMFVHADGLPAHFTTPEGKRLETPVYLARLAETIISTLTEETAYGHVFRVDMRLRPEGRFGPLSRSLGSCRAYYENWAENWERQALLKARFVAGNRALGDAFLHALAPYVYRRQISGAFLNDIRVNKRRIEQTCLRKGEEQTNIKTGYGGIRDIEFIVQLLQLEFGGSQLRLRTPNTLTALARLNDANFLTDREAEELGDDYRWLRTLEHRLQLLNDFQTQTLPAPNDDRERTLLARRMRYAGRAAFEADLARRRNRVRGYLDRLFYDQDRRFYPALPSDIDPLWKGIPALLEVLDTPAAQADMGARLTLAGFRDVPTALRLLLLMRHHQEFSDAPPQISERFKTIAPSLLDTLARSPDPDAALAGVETLAVPYRDPLYMLFEGRPDFMWRLVRLASVPPLITRLAKHQEWLYPLLSAEDTLPDAFQDSVDETGEAIPDALRSARHVQELADRIGKLQSRDGQLKMIALFYQRERLRLGARDIWNEADVADVMARLSRLTEAMLQILLRFCAQPRIAAHPNPDFADRVLSQVAILGLGRLGGAELNYSSDWDLLFVYDIERPRQEEGEQGERHALVSRLVQDFLAAIEALKMRGANIEVDMRLRPWGRQGGLIYTVRGYLDYFNAHAETWERQAMLKARFVAGNPRVGRRLEKVLRGSSGGRGITPTQDAAIHAMKGRIEHERLKSLERVTDLKLGHGGLSDIEWLAQRLQLQHGPAFPAVRVPGTLRALEALEALRALDRSEVNVLTSAYRLLTRVRNAMTLLAGAPQDVFPADPLRRRVLARLLGYEDSLLLRAEAILQEDVQADMHEVRRIFNKRFREATAKHTK